MTVEELDIVDRRGMRLQDERGRITYAEQKGEERGKEKGRIEQTIALVMRLLKKRFGEIPVTITSKVEDLPLSDLENLTEDIFDFQNLQDLENWLD